jgi:hypothetical protein
MPRGTARRGRGQGRGNYKITSTRSERESALERLGKVIYPKDINNKNLRSKYSKVYGQDKTTTSCIVTLPTERDIKLLTKKFIKTYYESFDQPGRTNLENFYHPDALFSFSSTHPVPCVGRNLIAVRDPSERLSMLVFEKTNIARTLASFAPTEHLVNYLTVDVSFYIANPMAITCLQLVVTGVFKDTTVANDPLRAFTRIFVLKHTATDKEGEPMYQILNDMFMLQMPTPDQIKKYHQDAQAQKRFSFQQNQQQQQRPTNSTGASSLYTKRGKEQQIESIMSKTQLTRQGAEQLLTESGWDEDKSLETYNRLLPQHKIPPELFRK